jgi:DNA-binding CsgD family transcriptional regulator
MMQRMGMPTLTHKQQCVLEAIAEGHETMEISRRLGTTPVSVEGHIRAMFIKAGVRNRAALVAVAFRCGWLSVDSENAGKGPAQSPRYRSSLPATDTTYRS